MVSLRDHFLKAPETSFDVCAGRDVVFDFVDEGGEGDASGVGWGIFAAGGKVNSRHSDIGNGMGTSHVL